MLPKGYINCPLSALSEIRLIFVQFVGYEPIINQDQRKGWLELNLSFSVFTPFGLFLIEFLFFFLST